MAIDPICGMTVNEASSRHAERDGQTFQFCSDRCLQKFMSAPANSKPEAKSSDHSQTPSAAHEHSKPSAAKVGASAAKPVYTCPMHPEVQQERPGDCPKCGMPLELKAVTADTAVEEDAELHDMTRRLWIGAALTLPVFVLAMGHLIPAMAWQSWVDGEA